MPTLFAAALLAVLLAALPVASAAARQDEPPVPAERVEEVEVFGADGFADPPLDERSDDCDTAREARRDIDCDYDPGDAPLQTPLSE